MTVKFGHCKDKSSKSNSTEKTTLLKLMPLLLNYLTLTSCSDCTCAADEW